MHQGYHPCNILISKLLLYDKGLWLFSIRFPVSNANYNKKSTAFIYKVTWSSEVTTNLADSLHFSNSKFLRIPVKFFTGFKQNPI